MTPNARVEHRLPGRLRLRIPDRKGDAEWFARVRESLAGLAPVLQVRTNKRTAGLLIEHTGDGLDWLYAHLRSDALFELPDAGPDEERMGGTETEAAAEGLAAMSVEPRNLAALGLTLLAVRQALRGNILAPAATLLWYAFDLASRRPGRD